MTARQTPTNIAAAAITAAEIKKLLNLTPHPREGGWYVRTYESDDHIGHAALELRYLQRGGSGPRRTGTAIYYLLEPDTFSEMHRLASDEIFHFYLGDPVEMLQLLPDGRTRTVILGNNLAAGQTPQLVVPHSVWQGSRLVAGGQFALLGCTVSPGFEYEDYEAAPRATLCTQYTEQAAMITQLTRE